MANISHRLIQFKNQLKWILAILIILGYHSRRLVQYSILGDDVIRIVDAKTLDLKNQLFRPFSEHVAPGFEFITAILIRTFGNNLNQTAYILTFTALASWIFFLGTMSLWVKKITGREEVAWMSFILTGISATCLEVPWWFSAATYSLSAGFIFLVLLALELQWKNDLTKWFIIAVLSSLAMSFSALGVLVVVLGPSMALAKYGLNRITIQTTCTIVFGLGFYWLICQVFGENLITAAVNNNRKMTDIPLGLSFAFAVPGGVALPLFIGLDAKRVTYNFSILLTIPITLLIFTLIFYYFRRSQMKYNILILLILPYLVLYPTRAGLISTGRWQQPDFLYFWTSRYHLFAVVAFSILFATLFHDLTGKMKYRNVFIVLFILVFMMIQQGNIKYWTWMMDQPDQRKTLAALDHLKEISEMKGISSEQLKTILPPVRRGWNASVLELRPDAFPLTQLIARREKLNQDNSDNIINFNKKKELMNLIQKEMSIEEWGWLTEGRLLNLSSTRPSEPFLPVITDVVKLEKATKINAFSWNIHEWGGFVEFEISLHQKNQVIYFQNVHSDCPVIFQWSADESLFPDYAKAWLEIRPADNLPTIEFVSFSVNDLMIRPDTLIFPNIVRIRVRPLLPGLLKIQNILVSEVSGS